MSAVCDPRSAKTPNTDAHSAFLNMLPAIRRAAQIAFRKAGPELRDDLTSEVVARAYVDFSRLVERGELDLAMPTPLARYAIAKVRAGRRVGARLRIRDALSQYAQFQKRFVLQRLDYFDGEQECWRQMVVEDGHASPGDIAAFRLDFGSWLRRLTTRLRKIALALAYGETTQAVAKMFRLSPGRISQIRQWLRRSWEAFQGERAFA